MTPEEQEAYRKACEQTDAIFALEGWQPTEQSKAIDEAVMAGRVTSSQVIREMVAYIKQRGTVDGFVASRLWG